MSKIIDRKAVFAYFQQHIPSLTYKPTGNLSACNPATAESNPSLSLDLDKGAFHDHATHESGGLVDFHRMIHPELSPAECKRAIQYLLCEEEPSNYIYCDESGVEQYLKRRDALKNILFLHLKDGKLVPGAGTAARFLYRLPEVLIADTVFYVEGEKCVELLFNALHTTPAEWGVVAVTTAGGANDFKAEFAEHFRGKRLFVLPDEDQPGLKCADAVVQAAFGVAKEIKVVRLSGLGDGEDCEQFLERNSAEALIAETEQAAVLEGIPALVLPAEQRGSDGRVVDWEKREHACYRYFKTFEELKEEPQSFLIDGFLARGNCAISADPGVGKTWLALGISLALGTGEPLAGRFKVNEKAPVLYLSPEVGDGGLRKRMVKVGLDKVHPAWFQCRTLDSELRDIDDKHILAAVNRIRPVVILDTLSQFIRGDENSAEFARQLNEKINKLRNAGAISVLALHHLVKNRKEKEISISGAMRGSGALVGNLDLALALEKPSKGADCDFIVSNPKNRDAETQQNIRLRGNFEGDRFKFECPAMEKSTAKKDTQMTELAELAAQVAAIRTEHPGMSLENIAAKLGTTRPTLQRNLKKHEQLFQIAASWTRREVA